MVQRTGMFEVIRFRSSLTLEAATAMPKHPDREPTPWYRTDALEPSQDTVFQHDVAPNDPSMQSLQRPAWVPLPLPELTPQQRMVLAVRKYGFAVALVAIVALALFFYFSEAQSSAQRAELDLAQLAAATAAEPKLSATPGPETADARAATLSVRSAPLGATVFIDFDSVGVTPLDFHTVPAGVYILSLQKPNYATLDTVLVLAGGQAPVLAFALQADAGARQPASPAVVERSVVAEGPAVQQQREPVAPRMATGEILITSEPAGASVQLGGKLVGTTPLALRDVVPGTHEVVLQLDDFDPFVATVELEAAQTSAVHGRFGAASGTLRVLVRPWGSIYIDGELHKQDTDVQYVTSLGAGRHTVKAIHPALGEIEEVVQIQQGTSQRVVMDFNQFLARRTSNASQQAQAPAQPAAAEPEEASKLLMEDGVYVMAEEPPQLIGGLERLHQNTRYPEAAYQAGLSGRVYLRFVVDEEGRVVNPEVTRGIGMGADEEALRAIQRARFVPGKVGGKPVKVRHALFINFQATE